MTAHERLVYDYLATNRGAFFTIRQVRQALGLTDNQARGVLHALWRASRIDAHASTGPIEISYGIEEVNHVAVRRNPEAR